MKTRQIVAVVASTVLEVETGGGLRYVAFAGQSVEALRGASIDAESAEAPNLATIALHTGYPCNTNVAHILLYFCCISGEE